MPQANLLKSSLSELYSNSKSSFSSLTLSGDDLDCWGFNCNIGISSRGIQFPLGIWKTLEILTFIKKFLADGFVLNLHKPLYFENSISKWFWLNFYVLRQVKFLHWLRNKCITLCIEINNPKNPAFFLDLRTETKNPVFQNHMIF